MAACAFIKPGGDRCGATAMRGYSTCYGHRPDLANERRRSASKGGKRGGRGRGGPAVEVTKLKSQLSDLYAAVLDGRTEPKVGAVAAQIANVRARLVDTELKVLETRELEARIEELSEAFERQQGVRRHGT